MQKNPCLSCEYLAEDKNAEVCMKCEKRVAYVRGLGSLVDMQALINSQGSCQTDGRQAGGGEIPPSPPLQRGETGGILKKENGMENQAEKTTKICKGEVCRTINPAGVERPLGDFGPDKKNKDGKLGACRMCIAYGVMRRNASEKKPAPDPKEYAATYNRYKKAGERKHTKDNDARRDLIVVLDFSGRPDLYQKIAERGAWDILVTTLEGS